MSVILDEENWVLFWIKKIYIEVQNAKNKKKEKKERKKERKA